jgi:hypothetical protein
VIGADAEAGGPDAGQIPQHAHGIDVAPAQHGHGSPSSHHRGRYRQAAFRLDALAAPYERAGGRLHLPMPERHEDQAARHVVVRPGQDLDAAQEVLGRHPQPG